MLIAKSSFTVVLDTVMENEENEQLYIDEMTIIDSSQNEHYLKLDNIELLLDIIGGKHDIKISGNIFDVEEDQEIFRVNIENNELSTPLKKLIKKLESEDTLNEHESISLLLMDFIELVEKSNLDCSSLTLELILRELIRDVNDIQERPKIFKTENYVFLRLSNAQDREDKQ